MTQARAGRILALARRQGCWPRWPGRPSCFAAILRTSGPGASEPAATNTSPSGGATLHKSLSLVWRMRPLAVTGHGSATIWDKSTPVQSTALLLKGGYGLIWTRRRAKMCKRSYRTMPPAPAEQSGLRRLCCAVGDGVSNTVSVQPSGR